MTQLRPTQLALLHGDEPLTPDGAKVLDFWRWAFSDLRSNVVRGVLAEYLVASALGADLASPRNAWDNYDFRTRQGWRVEVKSSAYLQSWSQRRPSAITFARLRGRFWVEETATYVGEPTIRADLFVFAVHTCQEPGSYDVLDIDQWQFYPVPASIVTDWPERVGLPRVSAVSTPCTWRGLPAACEAAMSGPHDTRV